MKRHNITYVILTAWLLGSAQLWTSCSAVDDEPDSSRKAVLLTASSGDIQSVYGSMRSVDGLYESTTGFDGGEQLQLYLYNSAYPSVIVSGTYNVGAPDVTYKKSGLTYSSGTELLYPLDAANSGTPAFTVYGVYPAASTTSHTVRYSQTNTDDGNANYKASDLMYASTTLTWTSAADKDNARNLQFDHQLAKLKLTIVKAKEVGEVQAVRMVNTKRTVSVTPAYDGLTLGTPTTATDDEYGDYILLSEGEDASDAQQTYNYCCIFVPGTWTDASFIEVTADGGTATLKTTMTFTGGNEYQLTLSIDPTALSLTSTIENWSEGDALPQDSLIY